MNFPDTHFFIYVHKTSRHANANVPEQYQRPDSPGVLAGEALLYPYIQAGIVTVVWLPLDRFDMLHSSKFMQAHDNMTADHNAPDDGYHERCNNDFL